MNAEQRISREGWPNLNRSGSKFVREIRDRGYTVPYFKFEIDASAEDSEHRVKVGLLRTNCYNPHRYGDVSMDWAIFNTSVNTEGDFFTGISEKGFVYRVFPKEGLKVPFRYSRALYLPGFDDPFVVTLFELETREAYYKDGNPMGKKLDHIDTVEVPQRIDVRNILNHFGYFHLSCPSLDQNPLFLNQPT